MSELIVGLDAASNGTYQEKEITKNLPKKVEVEQTKLYDYLNSLANEVDCQRFVVTLMNREEYDVDVDVTVYDDYVE